MDAADIGLISVSAGSVDASALPSLTWNVGQIDAGTSAALVLRADVVAPLPNGTLVIKGNREIRVNNENQRITLSGLIRPVDISPDNTILSSYVANARIEYTGSGSVSDKQRPGWLTRFIDFIWPF